MQNEPIPALEPASIPDSDITPETQTLTCDPPAPASDARENLHALLNSNARPNLSLQPVAPAAALSPATVIDAPPAGPLALPQNKARRRGRIARLPKLHRDLVNRMLWNGVPYKNIVAALGEVGFTVTERNISNWAQGGYLEWRFHQDLVIENRLSQDHLVDHLRREDAPELAEVGLQAAATRLSQIFLQKAAHAENVEGNLDSFSQMVDILSRLNHEIGVLQKQRDDSSRTLGPAHDAVRIKDEEQKVARNLEWDYSDPDDPASGLGNPAEPPLLPPYPVSSDLEIRDLSKKRREEIQRLEFMKKMLNTTSKNSPALSNQSQGDNTLPTPR